MMLFGCEGKRLLKRKRYCRGLALLLSLSMALSLFGGTLAYAADDPWIEEQLRKIEAQYNSGIMPITFAEEGVIPWDKFEPSGLPADADWNTALEDHSFPYHDNYVVDSSGVLAEKFPTFSHMSFVNVTVDGVPVRRLGVLSRSGKEDVYYYLTLDHTEAEGSHSVSAVMLGKGRKFTVNYEYQVFNISYEVRMAEGTDWPGGVDPNGSQDEKAAYDALLNRVLGGTQHTRSVNGACSFEVSLADLYDYQAVVWCQKLDADGNAVGNPYELTGQREDKPDHVVNQGYPLGMEPKYKDDDDFGVDAVSSPTTRLFGAAFYDDQMTSDLHIVVELKQVHGENDPPVFNARPFLNSENAGNRGTSAKPDSGANEGSAKGGNIDPEQGWSGNWGTFKTETKPMAPDGKGGYGYIWTFQTNTNTVDNFMLDELSVNGVSMNVPVQPLNAWTQEQVNEGVGKDGEKRVYGETTTALTLSDGTHVELEYVRYFHSGATPQRVYQIRVTNAHSNVNITSGNLMMYGGGAPEFSVISKVGVYTNNESQAAIGFYRNDTWDDEAFKTLPQVIVSSDNGLGNDSGHKGANIRFKLRDGYEDIEYAWQISEAGTAAGQSTNVWEDGIQIQERKPDAIVPWGDAPDQLELGHIYGPDADGWYYIRIEWNPAVNKMAMLKCTAKHMKYMVRYMPGEIAGAENMPHYSHNLNSVAHGDELWWDDYQAICGAENSLYDDNTGLFYDKVRNPQISVSGAVPTDPRANEAGSTGAKSFRYWTLADENGNPICQYTDTEDGGRVKAAYVDVEKKSDTGFVSADGNPVTPDSENGRNKLLLTVDPAKGLSLADIESYGIKTELPEVDGEKSLVNGEDANLYVIRLAAIWGEMPTYFTYNVAMGYEDETGLFHHLTKLQEVRTQNLVYADDPSSALLEVGVDTEHGRFVEWLAQRPFYTFDTVKNTTPTGDGEWEPLPNFGNESPGTNGRANRENAGYRILGDYMYMVQNEGTIYIYMKPANGAIPISNIVEGLPEDSDEEFTYRITARYPGVDEEQAREFLPHQEDYYAWPSGGTAHNTTSNAIAVKFEIVTDDDPAADAQNNLKSVGEITLKANQAVDLYVPAGVYTIEEATGEFKYDVEVGDGGTFELMMKAGELIDRGKPAQLVREISAGDVGGFTTPAVFKYKAQPLPMDNTPTVTKTVTGDTLAGTQVFKFTLKPVADYGSDVMLASQNETITIDVDMSAAGRRTGSNSFAGVTFRKAGLYQFRITENTKDLPSGFTAQSESLIWTANVVNENGELKLHPNYTEIKFVNNYTNLNSANANIRPEVAVDVIGSHLIGGDFEFEIVSNATEGMEFRGGTEAVNDADGMIRFGYVEFSHEGTYTVTIGQNNTSTNSNIKYDEGEITITYEVVRDPEGKLTVETPIYSKEDGVIVEDNKTFINQASVESGFTVRKNFVDGAGSPQPWNNAAFTARVVMTGGNAANVARTAGDDTITFTSDSRIGEFKFSFLAAGDYIFEVKEDIPLSSDARIDGVTYDNHTYQVVIHVADEGGGKLTPTVFLNGTETNNADVAITNTYSKDRITIPINAKKTLNGSSLYANRFTFLLEKNGDPSYQRMAGNGADGRIVFDIEYFTQPGICYYTLTEVDNGDSNITYDKTTYTVILEIDRVNTDGPLKANITYINDKTGEKLSGNAIPNFINTYSDTKNPGPGWSPGSDGPALNMDDHFAYLIGYNDGTVRPEANITRAEAVTIFFRLLTDDMRGKYWSTTNPYSDVEQSAWYNNAISTMANLGVINGYDNGAFRPNANITRSELTKIAVSLLHHTGLQLTGGTIFDDVSPGEWYTKFVETATELGLIKGYPDNTFRPNDAITRAETVAIINRVLRRKPHQNGLLADMIVWPDNMNVDTWYYADIQEATNSHNFQMDLYKPNGTYEHWTALLPVRDWAAFERMWAHLYSAR